MAIYVSENDSDLYPLIKCADMVGDIAYVLFMAPQQGVLLCTDVAKGWIEDKPMYQAGTYEYNWYEIAFEEIRGILRLNNRNMRVPGDKNEYPKLMRDTINDVIYIAARDGMAYPIRWYEDNQMMPLKISQISHCLEDFDGTLYMRNQ